MRSSSAIFLSLFASVTASRPRLHAVTYANIPDPRVALSVGTAELLGFYPVVVGYGHEATWAYGLATLANKVRSYIFNKTNGDDIILFFDAWDVIFQGGEEEIVDRFLDIERREQRSLIYHAEASCTSSRVDDYPPSKSIWRYLNCGLYIGRSWAMRELYKNPLKDPLQDKEGRSIRLQNWHTEYFLDNQDKAALDTGCELMQVVLAIEGLHGLADHLDDPGARGLVVSDGKLVNTVTHTTPPILHFPGVGHWPDWWHEERVGTCTAYEFFRDAGHPALAQLMEKRSNNQKGFETQPWKALCGPSLTAFDWWGVRVSHVGDVVAWLGHQGAPLGVCSLWIFCTVIVALRLLSGKSGRWVARQLRFFRVSLLAPLGRLRYSGPELQCYPP